MSGINDWILCYIDEHIEEELTVTGIAEEAGYSPSYLSRNFKNEMGIALKDYVTRRKLVKASEKIISGYRVIDAALLYGWETHAGFTKAFKKEFGFSPSFLKVMLNGIRDIGERSMKESRFLETTKSGMCKEKVYESLVEKMRENEISYESSELERMCLLADRAYEGVKRYSGEEYITHPLNVTVLLADMGAELNTIYAGLFCDVEKKGVISLEQLKRWLPEEVTEIISRAGAFDFEQAEEESEQVIFIKLAERLHNLRTMEFMDRAEWKKRAEETIKLFLPMAKRIGNKKLTDELCSLSMKYL